MSFVALLFSIFLAALYPTFAQKPPLNVTLPQTLTSSQKNNVVQDNFLGISFELSSFNTLWGNTTDSMPDATQNYLANLRARMNHPLRIRIGGNSMDASTYVPSQKVMINLTDPSAYFNDVPCNFGPVFFDVLNSMYDRVGSMQFIIGLSMLDPQDDENVVELATVAEQQLGNRLDAMLLGNEPDLYAGHGTRANYTIADYIPEIGKVLNDFRNSSAGNLLTNTIIGGPSICCAWSLSDVLGAGLAQYPYKYYSLQHYPQNICSGPNPQNTNISYFLSHSNVGSFVTWNEAGINMAKNAGVPVLLSEYNSVSCGGSNVSSTFAASLWAIDAALKSAASNFSAVYLHTREFGVTYNLFDPPSPTTSTEPGWRTGSPYYSALFMSEVVSPNGSVVIDLNIDNSNTDPSSSVAAYGIYDSNGTAFSRSKLILLNYNNGESQSFTIPLNTTHAVGVRTLVAPDVAETTNISWAGQSIGRSGELEGLQTTSYEHCWNGCNITVPGPGVALVLFNPRYGLDSFYEGNSTIAGITSNATTSGCMIRTLPSMLRFMALSVVSLMLID